MTATIATDRVRDALHHAASIRPPVGGFPYFAEALRVAGLVSIDTALATGSSVYHLSDEAVTDTFAAFGGGLAPVPTWDEAAVIAAIRVDQAGHTTFPEFLAAAWRGGVIHFRVDLIARTCTYYGAAENVYVERYPSVDIEA
jgi:uncharacterized protein YbcV (DUF1398 family)